MKLGNIRNATTSVVCPKKRRRHLGTVFTQFSHIVTIVWDIVRKEFIQNMNGDRQNVINVLEQSKEICNKAAALVVTTQGFLKRRRTGLLTTVFDVNEEVYNDIEDLRQIQLTEFLKKLNLVIRSVN